MVRIRLRRVGRKKAPAYRIVVADSKSPRDGKFIEIIGQYAPRASDEQKVTLDAIRADYWLSVGAQPSDTVRSILRRAGVLKARHEARLARERQASAVALPEVSSPTAVAAQPTPTDTPVAAMPAAPGVAATPESPIDEMRAVASPGVTDAVSDDTVSEGSAPAAEA